MIIYVYTLEDMSLYIYIYIMIHDVWWYLHKHVKQSQIFARHRGRQLIAKEALLRNESRVLWGVLDVSGYGHGMPRLWPAWLMMAFGGHNWAYNII